MYGTKHTPFLATKEDPCTAVGVGVVVFTVRVSFQQLRTPLKK